MTAFDTQEMQRRIRGERVARLATTGRDGRPHIAPITFAPGENTLYFAVDHKPKKSRHLQRLRNIEDNPAVCVMVDHYEDDWAALWWVRADGTARILGEGAEFDKAVALLTERYEQYRSVPLTGPVVAIAIERMTGWSAS